MSNRKLEFTVERAVADEATFCDVFELLIDLHKAGGYAVMDTEKATAAAYSTMRDGVVFVARRASGEAVGTLGLKELSFWYSNDTFLQDAWFFVKPEYRNGLVGMKLCHAARKEAEKQDKILFVTVTNPDRKPKKTGLMVESINAGFIPVGYTVKLR